MFYKGRAHERGEIFEYYLPWVKIEYLFSRIIFHSREGFFVEMVSLTKNKEKLIGNDLWTNCDLVATATRKIGTERIPKRLCPDIKIDNIDQETIFLTCKQFTYLKDNYQDNLFLIDKHVIEQIE